MMMEGWKRRELGEEIGFEGSVVIRRKRMRMVTEIRVGSRGRGRLEGEI